MDWWFILEIAIKFMLAISIGIFYCKIVDSFDDGIMRAMKSKKGNKL